ncbi:MAG: hypothetical protein KAS13_06085 [Candidatus Omnitrophica bacterium]|nr:hypothetical protein [Candidatus Omnitrophota bacterium]
MGPGTQLLLSINARRVIKKVDIIVGYKCYLDLIKN